MILPIPFHKNPVWLSIWLPILPRNTEMTITLHKLLLVTYIKAQNSYSGDLTPNIFLKFNMAAKRPNQITEITMELNSIMALAEYYILYLTYHIRKMFYCSLMSIYIMLMSTHTCQRILFIFSSTVTFGQCRLSDRGHLSVHPSWSRPYCRPICYLNVKEFQDLNWDIWKSRS